MNGLKAGDICLERDTYRPLKLISVRESNPDTYQGNCYVEDLKTGVHSFIYGSQLKSVDEVTRQLTFIAGRLGKALKHV